MIFIKIGPTPPPQSNCDKNQKYSTKNRIKSVQFRDNGDHIVLNLAKNSENTENYHANVLKNRLKMEKLREGNSFIQSSTNNTDSISGIIRS